MVIGLYSSHIEEEDQGGYKEIEEWTRSNIVLNCF